MKERGVKQVLPCISDSVVPDRQRMYKSKMWSGISNGIAHLYKNLVCDIKSFLQYLTLIYSLLVSVQVIINVL